MPIKDHLRLGVAIWDWIDRGWSVWGKLPGWLRTGIVLWGSTLVTGAVGFLAGVGLWLHGFVADYWAAALIGILAGAGAATAIQPTIATVGAGLADVLATKRTGKPRPKLLSADDKEYVQDFRTLWNRYGDDATREFHSFFDRCCQLAQRDSKIGHLVQSLFADVQRLNVQRGLMSGAVAPDSRMLPEEVLKCFHDLWGSYSTGMRCVARLMGHGQIQFVANTDGIPETNEQASFRRALIRWHVAHFAFAHALLDMHEKPAHRGVLKIFMGHNFDSDSYYVLFRRWADSKPSNDETEQDFYRGLLGSGPS